MWHISVRPPRSDEGEALYALPAEPEVEASGGEAKGNFERHGSSYSIGGFGGGDHHVATEA